MTQTTSPAPVPTASLRWGLGDAAVGCVVALVASGVLGVLWLAGTGAAELSLAGLAVAQIGLWSGFLGAPVFAVLLARRRSEA